MRKSLLVACFCVFECLRAFADPVVLYGPVRGDAAHTTGSGLACFPPFSSAGSGSDFAVGSSEKTNGQGAAQVLSGSDGSTVLFSKLGQSGAEYGSSIASLGDTNGDGRTDIIVGAPGAETAFIDLTNGGSTTEIVLREPFSIPGSRFGAAVEGLLGRAPTFPDTVALVGSPDSPSTEVFTPDGAVHFFSGLDGTFLFDCRGEFFFERGVRNLNRKHIRH